MRKLPHSQARRQFRQQRASAKHRGIEWVLSFEEWFEIWTSSGKYEQRGRRNGQYVMARKGDAGPYSVSNVYICTGTQNMLDAAVNKPVSRGGDTRSGRGRGWTLDKSSSVRPYCANYRGQKLGRFETADLAEAAYREAHLKHLQSLENEHAYQ